MDHTTQNVERVKCFLLVKWQERWLERNTTDDRADVPSDLSGACKFAALFAQALFGGEVVAHSDHCWVELDDGTTVDLTDGVDAEPYGYEPDEFLVCDPEFMYDDHCGEVPNVEFMESLDSCRPRVCRWLCEFKQG